MNGGNLRENPAPEVFNISEAELVVVNNGGPEATKDYVGFLTAEAKFFAESIAVYPKAALSPAKQEQLLTQYSLAMNDSRNLLEQPFPNRKPPEPTPVNPQPAPKPDSKFATFTDIAKRAFADLFKSDKDDFDLAA